MEVSKGVYEMENEIAKRWLYAIFRKTKDIFANSRRQQISFYERARKCWQSAAYGWQKNIYVDLDDSIKVTQSEFVNKLYIVKGHANRLDWDVEEKLKTYSENLL